MGAHQGTTRERPLQLCVVLGSRRTDSSQEQGPFPGSEVGGGGSPEPLKMYLGGKLLLHGYRVCLGDEHILEIGGGGGYTTL